MGSQEDQGLRKGEKGVLTRTVLHTFIHLIITRTVQSSHHPQFIIRKMSSKKLSSLYKVFHKVTEPGFAVRQRTEFLLLTSRLLTAGGSPRAARVSVLLNFVSLTSELGPLYTGAQ